MNFDAILREIEKDWIEESLHTSTFISGVSDVFHFTVFSEDGKIKIS